MFDYYFYCIYKIDFWLSVIFISAMITMPIIVWFKDRKKDKVKESHPPCAEGVTQSFDPWVGGL